jgi:hypothetical protein
MLGAGNQYRTKDASAIAFPCPIWKSPSELIAFNNWNIAHETQLCQRVSNCGVLPRWGRPCRTGSQAGGQVSCRGVPCFFANRTNGRGQPMPTIEPVQAWTYKNSALMAQTYVLAATSHELATCIMEGYDGRRVKEACEYEIGTIYQWRWRRDMTTIDHHHHGNDLDERNDNPTLPCDCPYRKVCFRDSFAVPMILDENSPSRDD